ncbi:hypothetical protein [Flavobacterium sp.]|uniref:hypothetical protein n=1 Tax=Flavobacterium sp. TaxID=239 RepID=UPI00260E3EBA|nr:hypothetical protein [Flavobacterium sp.]
MVVFNIYAFTQAILVGLLLGLFYLVGWDNDSGLLQMYLVYFLVAITYRSGMKGRLFWIIPTWLIALGFVFVFIGGYSNNSISPTLFRIVKILNYLFAMFLGYRMIFGLNAAFVKQYYQANLTLKNINSTDDYFVSNKKEFWAQVSHTFVYPNRFFLYVYPAYKLIFRGSVTKDDFIQHYDMLIHLIENRLVIPSNRHKLAGLSREIDRYNATSAYSHPSNALRNIAEVIDTENKALA